MRRFLMLSLCFVFVCAMAAPALAGWISGDAYNMHYPQLPDANGWDVAPSPGTVLADDWQCSQTGDVDGIHFWTSFQGYNDETPPDISSASFTVSIWSNNINNVPGSRLWSRTFTPGSYSIEHAGTGDQGWFALPSTYTEHDHDEYFQISMTDIDDPFEQVAGSTYWLAIARPTMSPEIGWKTTSSSHFGSNMIYGMEMNMMGNWMWMGQPQKTDPITGDPLDFAFVITSPVPEPSTFALLAVAMGLGLFVWKRRK